MVDVMEMSEDEYRQARAIAIAIARGGGMTAAEIADLASRRDPTKPPKSAREMTDAEYESAKAKAIRDSYR